ncbi:MAG TPA: anaerobic ribonucleoside-triphosphate reductase [Candidatus Nanopelagicaceae bacterium]|nr:anaerobic ribonucleoside-triphosphate reductase [Candidatus Nanopelagicaceae bacterium]
MNSDKNHDVLEKQLKTLGQKIRIDILKKLSLSSNPLPYSILQKEVLGSNPNSVNFSFHLKALRNSDLMDTTEDGYVLSALGRQILKNIVSIEKILNDKNKTIMIRTSKYSKEPFDSSKIENYLIKEGQVDTHLAKQISKEVEERLSKTNIEYLTAPLMREYINGVLLENGQEEIRHRLTRLGTPPYEVSRYFDNNRINPEQLLSKLGSEVSEQFLLLNLLPKNLADMYLSGELVLLNLNYWSLRPLGFYIDSNSIVSYLSKRKLVDINKLDKSIELIKLCSNFFDVLGKIKPYVSEDILLGNFSDFLFNCISSTENSKALINFLNSEIINHSNRIYDQKPHLSLEISSSGPFDNSDSLNLQIPSISYFLGRLFNQIDQNDGYTCPLIVFDYSLLLKNKSEYEFLRETINSPHSNDIIFSLNNNLNLLNSTLINVNKNNTKGELKSNVVLDKILINLHKIADNSKQNDSLFFENVQDKLSSVFELFAHKKDLINRKLSTSKQWNRIISDFIKPDTLSWIDNSLKSVSFFGLNEAIKTHCGMEIDRIENSESFAYNLLIFMKDIINEINQDHNENYILTQPHNGDYLSKHWCRSIDDVGNGTNKYCINMIRRDSKLSLKKKVQIYKNFEGIVDGGSVFTCNVNNKPIEELMAQLSSSKVNMFQLKIE